MFSRLLLIPLGLALIGVASLAVAVVNERLMHRHRQRGVTYAKATLRRDGGWGRAELFTPAGLKYQRLAARYGMTGMVLLIVALLAWIMVVAAS